MSGDVLDVRDEHGRLRRLAVALVVGVVVGVIAYLFAMQLVQPDSLRGDLYGGGQQQRAYKVVWMITAFAGGGAFTGVLAGLTRRARRAWFANRVPRAEVIGGAHGDR